MGDGPLFGRSDRDFLTPPSRNRASSCSVVAMVKFAQPGERCAQNTFVLSESCSAVRSWSAAGGIEVPLKSGSAAHDSAASGRDQCHGVALSG